MPRTSHGTGAPDAPHLSTRTSAPALRTAPHVAPRTAPHAPPHSHPRTRYDVCVRIGIDARKLHDFGIGTYIRNLLRQLARLDRETEYVLLSRPEDAAFLKALGENFRPVAETAGNYSISEQFRIPLALRREGVALFHAPHYVLPPLVPCPSVVTIHDCIHLVFPQYLPNKLALGYARTSMGMAARRAARVLTVSETSKRDIMKFFGTSPDKIDVIYNSYDEQFGVEPREEDINRVRERYQLQDEFVLYVGNVKPHKNVERLIEAFHLVRDRGLDHLKLVIIGDAVSKYAALRRAVHRHQLHKYVRFLGFVPEETLAIMYRLAGVFVFPSLYEGFGLPPLEAMASGTPVVVSNLSSLPEVAGDAAVLVDPYHPETIADGIERVLTDSVLRADLRARGLARAKQFSWETSVRRVREIYGEVIDAPVLAEAPAAAGRTGHRRSPSALSAPRVALVHDWLTGMRGGEKALEVLCERFPEAEIFTLVHIPGSVSRVIEDRPIHTSFVQHLPAVTRHYRNYLPLFPSAIERFRFEGFDLVLSVSHCCAKSVITPPEAVHVCYCLTPMRYAWDQFDAYFGPERLGRIGSGVMRPIMRRMADWDRRTAARPYRYVAISHYVAGRIGRYYNRQATVVYPPVNTSFYRPDGSAPEGFALIVSALVPYKRIEVAIDACAAGPRAAEDRRLGSRAGRAGTDGERARGISRPVVGRGDPVVVLPGIGCASARRGRFWDCSARSSGLRYARGGTRSRRRARNGGSE